MHIFNPAHLRTEQVDVKELPMVGIALFISFFFFFLLQKHYNRKKYLISNMAINASLLYIPIEPFTLFQNSSKSEQIFHFPYISSFMTKVYSCTDPMASLDLIYVVP